MLKRRILQAIALLIVVAGYFCFPIPELQLYGETMESNTAGKNYRSDREKLSDAELQKKLTPLQYKVVRGNGTEPAFNNKYWDNKKEGIYVDIVSGEPLFSSLDKFESGTGWPSFTAPLNPESVKLKTDSTFGMVRTEVRSREADSHLGHVFDDGPAPTGERYCINSAALRFIPVADLEREGYGQYLHLFRKNNDKNKTSGLEQATFGAGCFWHVEDEFKKIPGVVETDVGFMGGETKNPTYVQVCSGATGHAEVVNIKYDPHVVTYQKLLDVFWRIHDPTQLNRQGPDVGEQYRSVIYYRTPEQKRLAEESIGKLQSSARYKKKIATAVRPAGEFYMAEEYHQDYFDKAKKAVSFR